MSDIKVRDLRHHIKPFVPPVLEPLIKKLVRFLDADWHKRYPMGRSRKATARLPVGIRLDAGLSAVAA
jgi:hypothetical protein